MNNQSPFYLYILNKKEFLNKVCAICLNALFYPEIGDKMINCLRLQCRHMFHKECINQLINANHNKCPECRIQITQIININNSLELAIRCDAFDNGDVDKTLQHHFEINCLQIQNYPYHKTVFTRWREKRNLT
jgi:hypothetical protein